MSSQMEERIKDGGGSIIMSRVQTVYSEKLIDVFTSGSSRFEMYEGVKAVLEVVVAEAQLIAASEARDELKAVMFNEYFSLPCYGMPTIHEANECLANIKQGVKK